MRASWPIVLGTTAVAIALILLVIARGLRSSRDDIDRIQPGGVARVIVTGAERSLVFSWSFSTMVLFGYRFEIFPIATAIYLFLLMLVYGHRRWVAD